MACDALFRMRGSMLTSAATNPQRTMIMKKLLAVSLFVLTAFASVAGPAVASEIGSERGAPGWYGPREVS